jgi:hypothetical protein
MEAFNSAFYRSEQDYFLENFVQSVCSIKLDSSETIKLNAEFESLADRLQEVPMSLVHRDFQSRNIMIRDGQPVLIDFQGMRIGNFFYDLGSLLYDPYVILKEEERMELLAYYYSLSDQKTNWKAFKEMFWEASVERLLQALGAYGFLGLKQGHTGFLAHINKALDNLLDATAQNKRLLLIRLLAQNCENALSRKR